MNQNSSLVGLVRPSEARSIGYADSTTKAEQMREIPQSLERLNDEMIRMDKAISELGSRLAPICIEPPPSNASGGCVPDVGYACGVGGQIGSMTNSLRSFRATLDSITSRVQL